jgi:hypothetical protein
LDVIRTSDEPDSRGEALLALAEVLHLAHRPVEAGNAVREALGLFDEKGNVVTASRAKDLLATLGS